MRDLRWERLDVVQPPSPTGSFTFSNLFTRPAGRRPTPARRSPASCSGRCSSSRSTCSRTQIRNRAHFEEYFVQDDWRLSDRLTVNAGLRYTLNFPVDRERTIRRRSSTWRPSSSNISAATASRAPRAQLHKLNFGPRLGIVGRITDKTVARAGYGLVWIEMAGITTPFTTPVFPFLQTVRSGRSTTSRRLRAGRRARPSQPIPLTPDAGLGQGVFCRRPRPRLRLRAAVERLAAARADARTSSVEAAYVGSKITRVGIPDTNLNQLTVEQLALGAAAAAARAESVLRHHPALVVARRSDDPGRAAAEAVSGVHDRQPVSQQRRHDASTTASTSSSSSGSRAACRIWSATRDRS